MLCLYRYGSIMIEQRARKQRLLGYLSAALLAAPFASARAQEHGNPQPANAQNGDQEQALCLLNPQTGEGMRKISLPPALAKIFTPSKKLPLVQAQENCESGHDDNCDGQVNEGCPRCGDDQLQGDEECDDGVLNGSEGHACTGECKLEPAPGVRFAYQELGGDDCTKCMNRLCTQQVAECGGSSECVEAAKCPARENCLGRVHGARSCLCQDYEPFNDCWHSPIDNDRFDGPCVEDLESRIGSRDFTKYRWLSFDESASASAYRMYRCMTHSCEEVCHEIIHDLNPVCGNGIVEKGEECDDQNQINSDDCTNECKFASSAPLKDLELFRRTGQACQSCVRTACRSETRDCLEQPGCPQATQCQAKNACLGKFVGPLSCVCGDLSVQECAALARAPESGEPVEPSVFPGPCTQEIARNIGAIEARDMFRRLTDTSTPGGQANSFYLCVGRFCQAACGALFKEP